MISEAWRPVADALDRTHAAGRSVRLWLRDDDAVTATGGLDRLADLCASVAMPVLLAVIPARADEELAAWLADRPDVTPCQHGFAHTNHAAPGSKAVELGGERPLDEVLDELRQGRERLRSLVGPRLSAILVPPWNRIDEAVIPHLQALGFDALSTFGPASPPRPQAGEDLPLSRLNCDLDIIDWRRGRVGRRAENLAGTLSGLIDEASGSRRPIGLLTHHLVHDATAWTVLGEVLALCAAHPAVTLASAADLLRQRDV